MGACGWVGGTYATLGGEREDGQVFQLGLLFARQVGVLVAVVCIHASGFRSVSGRLRAACCRRRTIVVCPGPVRKEFEQAVALDVLFLVRELAGPIEVSPVQPVMPKRANGRL